MWELYYHDSEKENICMPYFWFSGPLCSVVIGLPLQIKDKGKHPGRHRLPPSKKLSGILVTLAGLYSSGLPLHGGSK